MTVINAIRDVAALGITGITLGGIPVQSFNYGAQKYERVRQGIRFSTAASLAAAAIPWILIMLFPAALIRIFNGDPDLIRLGVPAFRIYFATFVFMSLQIVGQTTSQALGRSKSAIFFSLLRKAFIVAPLTVLLPMWGLGTNGVFLAEPISKRPRRPGLLDHHDLYLLHPPGPAGESPATSLRFG